MVKRNRISHKNGHRKITGSRRRLAYLLCMTKTGQKYPTPELNIVDKTNHDAI